MEMKKLFNITKIGMLALLTIVFTGCQNRNSNSGSSLTGWSSKDKSAAGFSTKSNYKSQETPPGMVLIEGGTFTM